MHQPPLIPDVEGVGLAYREIEHLLVLLGGSGIGDSAYA